MQVTGPRLRRLIAEYGAVAICIQLFQFSLYLTLLTLAIMAGWQPESAAGNASALGAAFAITVLLKPVQVAITVLTTPFVARWLSRLRRADQP